MQSEDVEGKIQYFIITFNIDEITDTIICNWS